MANSLVCVFLLLFAGAVRSNREPFNVSYPPLKKSFVFESPTGPLNSVRPANASRTPVARLNIPVFPDIMRCDLKGGFPNKKMILGDFIMLTHDEQLWFFYHEFVVQMSLPVLSRLFEDEVDEQRNLDFMLEHDFPFRYRKSLSTLLIANQWLSFDGCQSMVAKLALPINDCQVRAALSGRLFLLQRKTRKETIQSSLCRNLIRLCRSIRVPGRFSGHRNTTGTQKRGCFSIQLRDLD